MLKRTISLLLCAAMAASLLTACSRNGQQGSASSNGSQSTSTPVDPDPQSDVLRFSAMSGPTGMGAAWLMSGKGDEGLKLTSEVVADNTAIKDALISGSVDVAAIATNLAATLSTKTDGSIQVLAVNTLGVLYVLEKGDSVHSMADLKGKTIYAVGQGANPEYILKHLLVQNGVDPADVDIQFLSPQEITAKMASSESGICMLPVPASTALMMKDQGVHVAVNLSDAWEELGEGSLPQGCIVARTQFIEEHPDQVEAFLREYEKSIAFMTAEANRSEAAQMVAELGIAPNDKVAAMAIPQAGLTFVTGEAMRTMLENYFAVLFEANPASIGGSMPYDSFYYGVD